MNRVRSMTGYAIYTDTLGEGVSFSLSLKSVNHRFLDLQFRLPAGWDGFESELRRRLKAGIERGHVDLTLDIERSSGGDLRINERALEEAVAALRVVGARLGLAAEPELSALLKLPGVVTVEARRSSLDEELRGKVLQAVERGLCLLQEAREAEGVALAAELRAGMERLRSASETVSELRMGVRQAQFERLRSRLEELMQAAMVDQGRLLTEAGLLAERSDVQEEAVRLRSHIERFLGVLNEGGPVGKKLDFLLQEMSREANTTLAKTGSSAGGDGLRITELGLTMKDEIERAREQVQNLE